MARLSRNYAPAALERDRHPGGGYRAIVDNLSSRATMSVRFLSVFICVPIEHMVIVVFALIVNLSSIDYEFEFRFRMSEPPPPLKRKHFDQISSLNIPIPPNRKRM